MNIGNFTRDGENLTGTINTLAIRAQVTIQAVNLTAKSAPDFRVYAGDLEIGAGWEKVSKSDRPYIDLRLDDPSFAAPIY
eukprot:gene20588-20505_t